VSRLPSLAMANASPNAPPNLSRTAFECAAARVQRSSLKHLNVRDGSSLLYHSNHCNHSIRSFVMMPSLSAANLAGDSGYATLTQSVSRKRATEKDYGDFAARPAAGRLPPRGALAHVSQGSSSYPEPST